MTETVKKQKPPKTYAEHVAKAAQRRVEALMASVAFVANQADESLLIVARRKISSYCGSSRYLRDEWNIDGTPKAPTPKTGPTGPYWPRTRDASPGFIVELWRRDGDEELVAFTSPVCVTSSAAFQIAKAWAVDNNVKIAKKFRIFYKGDLEYALDKVGLDKRRSAVVERIVALVASGSKQADVETVDSLLEACLSPLEKYYGHKLEFDSRWNAEGKWIGPKRPKRRKTTAPETAIAETVGDVETIGSILAKISVATSESQVGEC